MSATRTALLRSSLLATATLGAGAASAQYYDGPPPGAYGYNSPPPIVGYGPPPAYGGYDDGMAAYGPRPLPAHRVVAGLQDMGYRGIGRPRFTGTLYVIEASAPDGTQIGRAHV